MIATAIAAKSPERAVPEYPIQDFLANRWSRCGFTDRVVSEADAQFFVRGDPLGAFDL